jgi:hypothetical protein
MFLTTNSYFFGIEDDEEVQKQVFALQASFLATF